MSAFRNHIDPGCLFMKLQSLFRFVLSSAFCCIIAFPATGLTRENRILNFGVHVRGMGQLDPHFAAASQDRAVADMVFNGLLRFIPGNAPYLELDLAREMPGFKMINGKQVWRILLKKGVMFHPGPKTDAYELTADDVVFSKKNIYQTYYKMIREQLAEINIICNISFVSHREMHRQIRKAPVPLVIYPAWRPNADAYLTRFFHSDSIVVAGKNRIPIFPVLTGSII